MADCSFCGSEISFGRGVKFVKKDGKVLNFCSMKCEKNMLKLKRKPAKFKWTKMGSKKVVTKKTKK